MGDVEAGISSDKMYVSLMPKSAGMATITVTAVDRDGETVTSVEFDAMVMAATAIVAKTQAEVDAVFMKAGADMLTARGAAVMVPMNELFTIAPGVEPTYSADSDMTAIIEASARLVRLLLGEQLAGVDPERGDDRVERAASVALQQPAPVVAAADRLTPSRRSGNSSSMTATRRDVRCHLGDGWR